MPYAGNDSPSILSVDSVKKLHVIWANDVTRACDATPSVPISSNTNVDGIDGNGSQAGSLRVDEILAERCKIKIEHEIY